jgi:single-stranded-DNA-specific exonuclease
MLDEARSDGGQGAASRVSGAPLAGLELDGEVIANVPPRAARAGSFRDPGEASAAAVDLSRELGVAISAADALHRAGWASGEATRRFLDPKLAHLTPPEAMIDRDASAERIARAVRAGEKIAVFGDYDCDGITSAAIMTSILQALGGTATPLLATRLEGSYGLSHKALARVFATGATLLITCDCGSSDHERLAVARARGLDVVVIDHHLVPPEPLPVVAFLNPHRPECGFPYKGLASCGLALSLGAAVRRLLGQNLDLRPFLDLVAIGTVADVAPLTGDNRVLVKAGLQVLASGSRPGLRALAFSAKIDLPKGATAEDIAFRIAPRLNATGRLGDPDLSLELLLEKNPAKATGLAATMEQISLKRRAIQDLILAEAFEEIERCRYADAPGIVLAREGWHPGVVGIVAGRIASRFKRPTIIASIEGVSGRGSVRGPAGSQLHDALTLCKNELVGFGGHQAAAGVEVRADRVDALRDRWCEIYAERSAGRAAVDADELLADLRLDDRDDLCAAADDLARLEPCGEGNRAPLLLVRDVRLISARNLKGHLKVEVAWGRRATMGGFAFELGAQAESLASGARVDILGRLRRDAWRGGDAVELKIERIASA